MKMGERRDVRYIENIARNYFQNLFSSKGCGNFDHILSGIEICVSEEVNSKLIAKFTKEEVMLALKEMGPKRHLGTMDFLLFFSNSYGILLERM